MDNFEQKSEVDEIEEFLENAKIVITHFRKRILNDPIFLKTAKDSDCYIKLKEIKLIISEIEADNPEALRANSQFKIQQR